MTQNEFMTECALRYIEPSIALENDELVEALRERDDNQVIIILDSQF